MIFEEMFLEHNRSNGWLIFVIFSLLTALVILILTTTLFTRGYDGPYLSGVLTLIIFWLLLAKSYIKATTSWKDRETISDAISAYGVKGAATRSQLDRALPLSKGIWVGERRYWFDRGHLLTIGSSSAGKGSCFVIPCLLDPAFAESGSSFICLDPKGENALITKRAAEKNGFDVQVLNPFGIDCLPNNSFNPFDYTSKNDDNVIEYCDMLAEMVIPIKAGDSTSEHFDTQARSILSTYMLHLLDQDESEKTFATLFKWVNFAGDKLNNLLADMAVSESYRGIVGSIIEGFIDTKTNGGEKEASGILSTMKKGMEPFKNFKLQDST